MAGFNQTVPHTASGQSIPSAGSIQPGYTPPKQTPVSTKAYKVNDALHPPEYGTTISEEAAAELTRLGIEIDSSVTILKKGSQYTPTKIDGVEIYPNHVPDAVDYHMGREGKPKINLQPATGTSSWASDLDLAKVRYMANVGPYGGRGIQTAFDHYSYNMWKEYNINTAAMPVHGHIFVTRPDLYLYDSGMNVRPEILNRNDELATIARTNPQIFVDLTDRIRSGDETNINMYLSNMAYGIALSANTLATIETAGDKRGYHVSYGTKLKGNGNDTITVDFREDNMLTTTNTVRVWMKYIDLVYSGLLNPKLESNDSYMGPDDSCHALFRRIDYMSSIYFMVTDSTGTNLLFWRKYFGVYPISDNVNILSMTDNRITRPDRTSIQFAYLRSYDCRIKDLYTFNMLTSPELLQKPYVGMYDANKPGSNGPLGGPPFVVIDISGGNGTQISSSIFDRRPSWYPRLVHAGYGTQITGSDAFGSGSFIKKYWS